MQIHVTHTLACLGALGLCSWGTSIWRRKRCSPWKTPSDQKCYLCLRNELLPMSPVRTQEIWWALMDSNHRPTDYESAALTAVLRAPDQDNGCLTIEWWA